MSPITIRQTVLRVLAAAKPYAVPAETLLAEVNRLTRPALTADELRPHLGWLVDRSLIDFLPDELAPDDVGARKWLIREPGMVALHQ